MTELARNDILLANRRPGSGTGILFYTLLRGGGVKKGSIRGYDWEESSRTAVRALIRQGVADAAIGI